MDAKNTENSRPKLQRVTQACDFCHRRGLRCVQPPNQPTALADTATVTSDCLTCVKYGQQCTRYRKPKKRGTKPRPKPDSQGLASCIPTLPAENPYRTALSASHSIDTESTRSLSYCAGFSWQKNSGDGSCPFPSRETVEILINIYLDSIYPLYPFFCETELLLWWRNTAPAPDASYYSSVLCVCALSALQAERGALFSTEFDFVPSRNLTSSLLEEALRITPQVYHKGHEISLLRCYGILALIGTHMGDLEILHRYQGLYQGLAAQIGFYNEDRWPPDLTTCEKETRRRIFWTTYRLEVHNASVLGHPIRIPESQTYVHYPCGIHHVMIFPERNGKFENWIAGWNYTTELYRILEHAIVDFRSRRTARTTVLWSENRPKPSSILQQLTEMQSNLMPQFAQATMRSSDSGSNRCGFQVANILSTVHLVKMVVLASEDASFQDVCQTVIDLVNSLGTVPRDYKRAFGTPLVQELLGVGFMLTSIAGRLQTLSQTEHLQLTHIILFLVRFIDGLGDCIESARNAASCLRLNLSRIDQEHSRRIDSESPMSRQSAPSSSNDESSHADGRNLRLDLNMASCEYPDMGWIPPAPGC